MAKPSSKKLENNAKGRAEGNIGDGALIYKGAQGVDNPQVSAWELSLYGGLKMIGEDGKEITSTFGVLTGPAAIKQRAEDRHRRSAFIRKA